MQYVVTYDEPGKGTKEPYSKEGAVHFVSKLGCVTLEKAGELVDKMVAGKSLQIDGDTSIMIVCDCGNPKYKFPCSCEWSEQNPGTNSYSCEFCGLYEAGKPQCNKCQQNAQ